MKKYDESLVTSEVCMQCGWCCHVRFSASPGFNLADNEARKFIKLNLVDHDAVEFRGWNIEKNQVHFAMKCSQLEEKGDGRVSCKVYEDRPRICREYNCLENANRRGITLGSDFPPRAVIRSVHGKEIEIDDETKPA